MSNDDETFKVWIGCLACYNNGRLVGDWWEASQAGEVTIEDVHRTSSVTAPGHEELWVMDTENAPAWLAGQECSPQEAQAAADLLDELDEHERRAFGHWVANDRSGLDVRDPVELFRDEYAGTHESFRDYADELADDVLLAGAPEELAYYFDYEKWARDLLMGDYWTATDEEGVHVFRNS